MAGKAPVEVVDFEKQPLPLDLQGTKVPLAIGVVAGVEAVEGRNGVQKS